MTAIVAVSVFLVSVLCFHLGVSSAPGDIDPCDFWFRNDFDAPKPPQVKAYFDECLSNVECPSTHYCSYDTSEGDPNCSAMPCDTKPRKCVPRSRESEKCKVGKGDCADGLYCLVNYSRLPHGQYACAPKIPRGGKCDLFASFPCQRDMVCLRETNQCGKLIRDLEGDRCTSNKYCEQQDGLYCGYSPFPGRSGDFELKCMKKRHAGAACGDWYSLSQCAGFCTNKVCMKIREIGQSCSENIHCKNYVLSEGERVDGAICNVLRRPGFRQGICALESKLLRFPGQECDPTMDLCDARRNLRCEEHNGEFVCLQKSNLSEQCTAGSPFSFCNVKSAGFPLECRRRLALIKKAPYGADICVRVRETVKLGEICNRAEHALCEEGTTCVVGPGILSFSYVSFNPPPQIAYCMKQVPLGGDCSSKHTSFCAAGSFCINNTCQKAVREPLVPVTLSGIYAECTLRPCAPGLECVKGNYRIRCSVATVVARRGEECSDRPPKLVICEKGTDCSRGLISNDIKRCWPPRDVGGLCEADSSCKGHLKCRPNGSYGYMFNRTCYDPNTAAPLGAKCDPANSACAIGNYHFVLAKCLAKGSSFACQTEAELFGRCSPDDNIGCSTGLVCNDRSICVPFSEAKT